MKIEYFALLRDVTGKKEEEWHEPAATVGELLRALVARYGADFARWVSKDGQFGKLAIIMVNGRDVRGMQHLDTPLASTDTVVIFPPVGGG